MDPFVQDGGAIAAVAKVDLSPLCVGETFRRHALKASAHLACLASLRSHAGLLSFGPLASWVAAVIARKPGLPLGTSLGDTGLLLDAFFKPLGAAHR